VAIDTNHFLLTMGGVEHRRRDAYDGYATSSWSTPPPGPHDRLSHRSSSTPCRGENPVLSEAIAGTGGV